MPPILPPNSPITPPSSPYPPAGVSISTCVPGLAASASASASASDPTPAACPSPADKHDHQHRATTLETFALEAVPGSELCFPGLSPRDFTPLVECCYPLLRSRGIAAFYNAKSRTAQFSMSSIHNAFQGWFLTRVERMVQDGFILRSHLAYYIPPEADDEESTDLESIPGSQSDGEHSEEEDPEDEDEQNDLSVRRKLRDRFLMCLSEQPIAEFVAGFHDSTAKADYVIINCDRFIPNLVGEMGLSQAYERNTLGTALMDRVDLFLVGTDGRVHAVLIAVIDEYKSHRSYSRRFSGRIELWRWRPVEGRTEGGVYLDQKEDLFSKGSIKLRLSDVYGSAVSEVCPERRPSEKFEMKISWFREAQRKHLQQHLRHEKNVKAQKERSRDGDVGRNWEPYSQRR